MNKLHKTSLVHISHTSDHSMEIILYVCNVKGCICHTELYHIDRTTYCVALLQCLVHKCNINDIELQTHMYAYQNYAYKHRGTLTRFSHLEQPLSCVNVTLRYCFKHSTTIFNSSKSTYKRSKDQHLL